MTDDHVIDYRTWGMEFFHRAVTEDRVLRGVNGLSGRRIDVRPMGVGPGRLVKVTATGRIGTAAGRRTSREPVALHVTLPVPLELTIDLGMDRQRFQADIEVPLVITVHARRDLAIVLDIAPPTPSQVKVRLDGEGLRAQVLKVAAGVEGELRRFVAEYVAKELTKPYVKDATLIDVGAAIERASSGTGLKDGRAVGDEVTDDPDPALEAEIRANADLFVPEEPPA